MHRYEADGDYEVEMTVETYDGRVGSAAQTVSVQTHDVAITGLTTPRAAKANQSRTVTVRLANKRYPEQVYLELYKSGPWGFEWVDAIELTLPAKPGGGTTQGRFRYTYTQQDAAIGKVTFRAMVHLWDARDAFWSDNEAISAPVKVMP